MKSSKYLILLSRTGNMRPLNLLYATHKDLLFYFTIFLLFLFEHELPF